VLLDFRQPTLLIEAAEDLGLSRSAVLDPLGIEVRDVCDTHKKVEWTTVVSMCDQISRLVGGDVERLREVGRRMHKLPGYAPLRRLAGNIVSVRTLYEIGNGWVMPAKTFAPNYLAP